MAARQCDGERAGDRQHAACRQKFSEAEARYHHAEQKAEEKCREIEGRYERAGARGGIADMGVVYRQKIRDVRISEVKEEAQSEQKYFFISALRRAAYRRHGISPRISFG